MDYMDWILLFPLVLGLLLVLIGAGITAKRLKKPCTKHQTNYGSPLQRKRECYEPRRVRDDGGAKPPSGIEKVIPGDYVITEQDARRGWKELPTEDGDLVRVTIISMPGDIIHRKADND